MTRCVVGVVNGDVVKFSYLHCDGYPEHMVPALKNYTSAESLFESVIKQGGASYMEDNGAIAYPYGDMPYEVESFENFISEDHYWGAYFKYLYKDNRFMCFGIDPNEYDEEEWAEVVEKLSPLLDINAPNEYGAYDFK